MSSKSVSKTVAKKLKYYLDVKRREDAFDLSGPYLPKEDPTPLRAGPTLAYDGIHDRSLKHYFRRNSIKKQLQHMTVPPTMSKSREKAIRRYVDETMATVDYRLKPGPISPYAFPQTFKPRPPPQRPKALRTVDEYFRTKKGSQRRKMPVHVVGKPRRITRRSPPEHIHNYERERLVNMASKLIVATETVALPQQKKQSKGFQTSGKEFPRLERRSRSTESSTESALTSGHESEGSINERRTPVPPRSKSTSAQQRRPQSSFFKSSSLDETSRRGKSGVHVMIPDSSQQEKLRFLMDRMNLDGRGASIVVSHEAKKTRPKSAGYPLKSTTSTAVETDLPDYSDDDFCSGEESLPRESARTPRLSRVENKEHDMIDTCTQTVVHSATQTKFPEYSEQQVEREIFLPSKLHWADRGNIDQVDGRQPVAIATTGASTADISTSGTSAHASASHETQTRNLDLEPKVITYEVYVQTGDRLGAGSKVDVKMTIFGEYGNSGERQLLRSKTHRNKFQRGRVDVFVIDSLFLGKLRSIRIGHSETRLGYGWFLDRVYIKEGPEATRAFEFRCNRWFSSRDDDGQIMRDLPLYDTVPASHADAILPKEKERKEELYSPSESASSQSESEESSPREIEARAKEKSSRKKTKQKSQNKAKRTVKQETKKQEVEPLEDLGGFRGAKAENLFEVSEDEEQDQENQNEDRFFEPKEESESEQSEEEKIVNRKLEMEDKSVEKRKPPRHPNLAFAVKAKTRVKNSKVEEEDDERESKRRELEEQPAEEKEGNENEDTSGSQEEEHLESEKEEEKERKEKEEESPKQEENRKPKNLKGGAGQLRVVTTALSPFLRSRQAAHPSPIAEEPSGVSEDNQTQVKEEESHEDEPEVEFASQSGTKSAERPSSAKSDDFEEGFRAGIRKKQEEERKRHKASISESENILKKGSSIHDAAKNGNLDRIKELIQAVPAIKSAQDERGMTALHLAASNGHLDCVKWLAVSGVDLADEIPTGYTAMHLASMNGHVNCMMILSAMGSTIGGKTVDSLTPLHLASMSGHIECVKWLLANRARMDVEDSNGRTPLDIAEEYEHKAIIKLLTKFKKELTRQDSTLAQLMTAEKRRKSMDSTSDNDAAPSKVSDSGVGGMESEEDNWISDAEENEEVEKNEDKPLVRKASTHSIPDQEPSSRSRTDSIVSVEEKKKMFEIQRRKMKKRHSSFLDSIRMDVDNDEDF